MYAGYTDVAWRRHSVMICSAGKWLAQNVGTNGRTAMQYPKARILAIVGGFVGTAALVLLTFAMLTFATSNAQATPAIAKGKPCSTCHAGSPPSKSNLKK